MFEDIHSYLYLPENRFPCVYEAITIFDLPDQSPDLKVLLDELKHAGNDIYYSKWIERLLFELIRNIDANISISSLISMSILETRKIAIEPIDKFAEKILKTDLTSLIEWLKDVIYFLFARLGRPLAIDRVFSNVRFTNGTIKFVRLDLEFEDSIVDVRASRITTHVVDHARALKILSSLLSSKKTCFVLNLHTGTLVRYIFKN